MKISSVHLQNFRGIEDLKLELNNKSTVFFGINGVGKSTVLRAINILFSNIINKIVANRFKQGIGLELMDITFGKSTAKVTAEFDFGDSITNYSRTIERKGGKRAHSNINNFYKIFSEHYLKTDTPFNPDCVPIFVNYGVNRLVLDVPIRIRNTHTFDTLSAFQNAIESKIDFRTFFEWFRYQEDLENQMIKEKQDFSYSDEALRSVKKAITTLLGNVTNLRIERSPLAMKVDKDGIPLRIEQLSDGEKCTLALIGDLARRIALANPKSKTPLEGEGIVLIDEIELHMHPQWQRRILPMLNSVFPNVQFIITTHSPQVLGELDDTYNIFSLSKHNNAIQCTPINSLMAWDSNLILEELMETSSLTNDVKQQFSDLFILIDKKQFAEANALMNSIESKLNYINPEAIKARILIARGLKNEKDS